MTLEELKKIIPNSKNWIDAEEITFGWSGEQKYKVKTTLGEELLLRILSFEQFEKQKDGIEFLSNSSKVLNTVPKIFAQGTTLDNTSYYLLLNYIKGNNGMNQIEKLNKTQQYNIGIKMGKIIKELHAITPQQINKQYNKEFLEKIDKYYAFFTENKAKFAFLHNTEENLINLKNIVKTRPVVMIHNDFHLGNMIINKNEISLIDFNRATLGDNIKEFDCIAWSATHSEEFATGLLDAYLENENKEEFFNILRKYISLWELQMLSFIETEDDEERNIVLNLIKYTESWFDKNNIIPNWYLKNTKKEL